MFPSHRPPPGVPASSGLSPYSAFVRLVDALYNWGEVEYLRTSHNPDFVKHSPVAGKAIDDVIQYLKNVGWPTFKVRYQSLVSSCSANKRAVLHYRF